ncbi:MAG: sugar phosphate isomerase/epimerase [Clostridia bacterium]|nr:sugar phosphate isomerase/epimerase [Clostridia bacterium]
MAKISLSIGSLQGKYGDKRALEMAKEAGFDGVDFDVVSYGKRGRPDVYQLPQEEFEAYFKDIKAHADQLGIVIVQTHNLVAAYTPDPEICAERKQIALRGIEATALLGCEYTVVHCISTMQWGYDVPAKEMHLKNQEMYADFIPTAEKFGVKICMETFGRCRHKGVHGFDYFSNPELMLEEYESLPTEMKAFCMDTGHTNDAIGAGYLSVPNFIRLFGKRIKILHLHDNNTYSDQHLLPGQGSINWGETFKAFKEIGYDGYYNYEVNLAKFAPDYEALIPFLGKYLRSFTERFVD